MRDELIDQVRRSLRDDLARRLADAGIDVDLGERVAGDVGELLDSLLLAYQTAELDRHDCAVVGAFVFSVAWQRFLLHVLPLAVLAHGGDRRTAERLRLSPSPARSDAC